MSEPLFDYVVVVNEEYFAANRQLIKTWFIQHDSLWLWTCISRSHTSDYLVYFHDDTLAMLFKLSFETLPPNQPTLLIITDPT